MNTAAWFFCALCVCLSFSGCTRSDKITTYRKNQLNEQGTLLSYEEWVAAIGRDKADYLFTHNGDELNLLTSGAGQSNIIAFLNSVSDIAKVSALLGNEYDTPPSGLGATRLLRLMNRTDYFMTQPRFDSAPLADDDTIGALAELVNNISDVAAMRDKVVGLFNAIGVTRHLTDPNDEAKIDKVAILIAHLKPRSTVYHLINEINATKITTNLGDILLHTQSGHYLVDVVDNIANASAQNYRRLVYLINSCDSSMTEIVYGLVNLVETTIPGYPSRQRLYQFVNGLENGADWSTDPGGQPGGVQIFQTGVVGGSPQGSDSGFARLVTTLQMLANKPIESRNKLAFLLNGLDASGVNKLVRLFQDMARQSDLADSTDTGLLQVIADPSCNPAGDPCRRSTDNLLALINQVAPADFYRLRELVGGIESVSGSAVQQKAYLQKVRDLLHYLPQTQVSKTVSVITGVGIILPTSAPSGLNRLIRLLRNADGSDADSAKLALLIEHTSSAAYLIELLNTVIEPNFLTTTINGTADPTRLAALINTVGSAAKLDRISYLMNQLSAADIPKIYELINNTAVVATLSTIILNVDEAAPGEIVKLKDLIDLTIDSIYLDPVLDAANALKVAQLINAVTAVEKLSVVINDMTDTHTAKLVPLIDQVAIGDVAFLINHLSLSQVIRISVLLKNTHVNRVSYLVSLLNGITGADVFATPRLSSTGLGKLVNLIGYAANVAQIAETINTLYDNDDGDGNGTNHITRLLYIINTHTNSTNLVCLFTALDNTGYTTGADLGGLIVALSHDTVQPHYIHLLLENIAGCTQLDETADGVNPTADISLIAQLIGPLAATTQGVGVLGVAQLINHLNSNISAVKLATVLNGVNVSLRYISSTPNITKREGFVRLLSPIAGGGVNYAAVDFPGLGPRHIATMINSASDASDLVALINGNDLSDLVPLVGCLDRVGDLDPLTAQGIANLDPNFFTPCEAIGLAQQANPTAPHYWVP